MNILVIGSGGREHALAWSLSRSQQVNRLYFFPGNSGTAKYGENIILDFSNHEETLKIAREKEIDLVIIGPFRFIHMGVGEIFKNTNIKVFAPSIKASRIEGSKEFSKSIFNKLNIPTAKAFIAKDINSSVSFLEKNSKYPIVLKTDGPTYGVGVKVALNKKDAEDFLDNFFVKKTLQPSGSCVLIEEFLEGEEFTIHAFCDGNSAIMMPVSQDYKQLLDGDEGVNTAGIGAVAPILHVSQRTVEDIKNRVVIPILKELRGQGSPFVGIMYVGIIMKKDDWKVLEINARFGDPEAVCYLRLLSTDLVDIIKACLNRQLEQVRIEWSNNSICCVVITNEGYPEKISIGNPILGLNEEGSKDDPTIAFHCETFSQNNQIKTNGGHRVVCVSSSASTLEEARNLAYKKVRTIFFIGMHYRNDIGVKALKHDTNNKRNPLSKWLRPKSL